jgi:hypothetical protein
MRRNPPEFDWPAATLRHLDNQQVAVSKAKEALLDFWQHLNAEHDRLGETHPDAADIRRMRAALNRLYGAMQDLTPPIRDAANLAENLIDRRRWR